MRSLLTAILFCCSATMADTAPLDQAVRAGDIAAAQAAIAGGADINHPLPPLLMPPLTIAAIRNDLDMVQTLLTAGADPNQPGNRGMNALSAAVRSCRSAAAVIAALIDAGADLEDRSGAGLTPLMAAIQEERTDIALLLIARGANINTRNQYSDGVLNYAIYTENARVVQAAMARGVDTDQLNVLFTTGIYYYPGFGQARAHGGTNCAG